MKKGALFCLKGFTREPQPTTKGTGVLLGILVGLRNPAEFQLGASRVSALRLTGLMKSKELSLGLAQLTRV